MRPVFIAAALAIAAVLIGTAASAASGLVQRDETIQLPPKDARRLAAYFTTPVVSPVMAPAAKQILIAGAPPHFKLECTATVNAWGQAAAGSESISVRLIGPGEGGIWVAYRCGSRLLDLAQYYSERLAILEPANGRLRFFSLERDSASHTSDPTLYYRVNFAEQMKLAGVSASSFFVFETSETPGTLTARGNAEDRLLIIAETPSGIRRVLDLTTARWEIRRNEKARNSHAIVYRAHLSFERDNSGRVVTITDRFEQHPPDGLPRTGILRYVWDPAAGSFIARN